MSWTVIDFAFAAFFSLRPSNTTSSGGKSLLFPTPFAIKMALLDRVIVNYGVDEARSVFPAIRDLFIAIQGPEVITVTSPTERTHQFREGELVSINRRQEYCFYSGPLSIAFSSNDPRVRRELIFWITSLSYLGRKGGFLQYISHFVEDNLAPGFTNICESMSEEIVPSGILQYMDNMLESCRFEDVSRFHVSKHNPRQYYHIVIPYRPRPYEYGVVAYERIQR